MSLFVPDITYTSYLLLTYSNHHFVAENSARTELKPTEVIFANRKSKCNITCPKTLLYKVFETEPVTEWKKPHSHCVFTKTATDAYEVSKN